MSDLRELYQETILGHYKKPRNFGKLPPPSRHREGYNPLCGDKVTVYMHVKDDVVTDIRFEGSGCAISTASASMMTEALKGKTVAEAEEIFKRFHELVTGKEAGDNDNLGKLAVFAGVREFPARVKCATLAWHTFHAALEGGEQPVSTE
ncbi:MAG: SUF system NifU family Fe-S cluster assembly protein [Planctomycetes bacterium]|nr:SUF system NifU family Fe-S cluster assembly protein [Planctomycetota bacterium]